MRQAKEAAGEADVMVHGADLTQSLLRAEALDELEIHLVPVLLGEGRRLFEHLGADHIELELTRVIDTRGVDAPSLPGAQSTATWLAASSASAWASSMTSPSGPRT